tara:strand:+ start:299 stop:694 length:396 start_codon:yes stop_codon:yes gene_type:complete
MSKASLEVLRKAAEIQNKKGNDYQNPNSRIKQAMYYPRGCSTLLDTMIAKTLRLQSVLEAMENDTKYNPNFESLEDSCIDIINYASFFAAYMKGGIDGQDPDRDFLNRPIATTESFVDGHGDVHDMEAHDG